MADLESPDGPTDPASDPAGLFDGLASVDTADARGGGPGDGSPFPPPSMRDLQEAIRSWADAQTSYPMTAPA